jgi:ubiquinone/menaquinone biosynthesis C-methylase UbiE
MALEDDLAIHYARPTLEQKILTALKASGKDPQRLTPDDLAPVDEFHVGGRQATVDLADGMELRPDMTVLDIGCGLGGASRYLAHARGCRVSAIDMAPDFLRVAASLAARVGLGARVIYQEASALALPFEEATFDGATLMHVGMNIVDKAAMFREVRRVMKPDGVFGVYDIMRVGPGDVAFPVPWATNASTSFVGTPEEYRRDLQKAGFVVRSERNRRDFGLDYFRALQRRTAEKGVTPLGLHIPMGETAVRQMVNIFGNIERGVVAPVEMICRLEGS